MNGLFVTIQEWASEEGLSLTDVQINELMRAIQITREVEMYKTGWTPGDKPYKERELETKLGKLERTISQLEGFMRSKGYTVSFDENSVTEHTQIPCGTAHWSSHDIRHHFA